MDLAPNACSALSYPNVQTTDCIAGNGKFSKGQPGRLQVQISLDRTDHRTTKVGSNVHDLRPEVPCQRRASQSHGLTSCAPR